MHSCHTNTSVAIIGAGIAGLSCARALTDRGYSVTVFEKSRGPGGRMSTRCSTAINHQTPAPWQCDHGAQYFTARDPLFVAQVERWQNLGVVGPWQPRITTMGQRPTSHPATGSGHVRYVGLPRMTAPARQLAETLNVCSHTRIVAVNKQADGWLLTQEDQRACLGPFQHLVLAIPAQQAAELLSLYCSDVTDPAINAAITSCEQLALRPCWALMLHFSQHCKTDFDAAFVNPVAGNTQVISWIARDSSKPQRVAQVSDHSAADTWLIHAAPSWSEEHLEADQAWVVNALLSEFREATGIHLPPSEHSLHRWRYAQTGAHQGPGQIWLSKPGLGLCGDWLNGGRVEGAWLSGYQLAQQILSAGFPTTEIRARLMFR